MSTLFVKQTASVVTILPWSIGISTNDVQTAKIAQYQCILGIAIYKILLCSVHAITQEYIDGI